MPTTSTNSSPVKRPGLGRRAVSSHAVITRSPSSSSQAEHSHSHTQKAPGHRPHRAHVVGGGHRSHGRNPSLGKNLGKLQRHLSAQQFGPEYRLPQHQRKKSAPVTPAASPPRQQVHWDGAVDDSSPRTASFMKKNYSSPALRRSNSSVLPKKALVTDRPQTSSGKKKTVGFELADSTDEGEWEDTTQSPESTRRSSVAQSRDGDENPAILVDPLTFVKRSYPQFPRATSLPEPASRTFHDDDDDDGEGEGEGEGESGQDDDKDTQEVEQSSDTEDGHTEDTTRPPDQANIASRLLSPSHSARAPPAMSSISATAIPAPVDTLSRNASLTNMSSGQDGLRRPLSVANILQASTPITQAHATSSSIEGGVSRFIVNSKIATSRTDSDPNTPSSFLPHYHPQTPPSPNRSVASKKTRTSPSSRQPGSEPHSRTQQKLWLQRTAALNTSPDDSHGASASVSPSALDQGYNGTTRVGPGPYDPARATVNGVSRNGGALHQSESKHIRKAYEKSSLELTVVRRFQSPTGDSFSRLNAVLKNTKRLGSSHASRSGLGQPVKSAPALVLLQRGAKQQDRRDSSNADSFDSKQHVGRKQGNPQSSAVSVSHAYIQDPDEPPHPSHRLLSTSDDAAHGTTHGVEDEPAEDSFLPSETDMLIRRMWESREVATSG
ncbi:hypothetical protein BJX70DRAFT_353082 [Aspergillus crustosus]